MEKKVMLLFLKQYKMFQLIEKLRHKPNSTKKQIAFLVALSFAGIIFIVWLSVVYPDFRQSQEAEQRVADLTPSPISGFMASITTGFSAIGEQIAKMKDTMTSFSIDPAYYSATSTTE